jgi:glutathione S-transferase
MPEEGKRIFRDKLASRYKWLDGALADKSFLMGEHFGAADAYLFAVTRWAKPQGIQIEGLSHVMANHERVAARPAVQEALKFEGLLK